MVSDLKVIKLRNDCVTFTICVSAVLKWYPGLQKRVVYIAFD